MEVRGTGRVLFAAILLVMLGVLNIIYGIGALDDANIFVNDTRYILDNLNTLGWVLIIVGLIQLTGGFSLMSGGSYGYVRRDHRRRARRVRRAASRSAGRIPGGRSPMFAVCLWIVHGLVIYDGRSAATPARLDPELS